MGFARKIEEKIKKAPKAPGIYVFYEKKKILYIGKASDLRNRLKSYLRAGDFKNDRLQENATDVRTTTLRSEIEALIEEAKLIKKYDPPYNVLWRDDKTYFYAAFTKEKFPRIVVVHKNIVDPAFRNAHSAIIGPFTEGRALRLVLKMLRRRFSYCTCPKPHLRSCLNSQIGNCPGFCCRRNTEYDRADASRYKRNVTLIKDFLLGKHLKGFAADLSSEEKVSLEKILAHREFLEDLDPRGTAAATAGYTVEGYDISHLSGRETVAGMTAWFFDGNKVSMRPDSCRKFIIRNGKPGDDPAAMFEAVSRRLAHPEWEYPLLMVIDGGAGQFAAAKKAAALSPAAGKIRMISFAKPDSMVHGIGKKQVSLPEAPEELRKIIPAVVEGTHNYAVRFHRERRKKDFIKESGLW